MDDKYFMNKAINICKKGISKGQAPFGACIVKDGVVIACAHNSVLKSVNPSCHAEVNVIGKACKKLDTIDLSGCILYSTTEPCPMCFSASHWAKISKIVSGCTISDSKKFGYHELSVSNKYLSSKEQGKKIELVSKFMRKECLDLFELAKKQHEQLY